MKFRCQAIIFLIDPLSNHHQALQLRFAQFFDASFQPGYSSLNECLSAGPSLSEQISPLLLRFRTNAIGVIADIKQAFLQLSVRPEDRNFLRFLWWNTEDRSKLEFFRHCRVVFRSDIESIPLEC
ncbi:DUF1758 domain-containing protein [Caerostris extrusa]|uniref:DUF1758 domain-containing protein n=1 Tax=Caerostris extrusa TaxID=172846 RepID=A0AAV4X8Q0_CAEEX|nr:DUF1758 domain-containing protein [Caerostris extrusa]